MAKNESGIDVFGIVIKVMGKNYLVKLDDLEMEITAYAKGNIRRNNIKIIEGDRVKVKLCEYKPNQGIIIYRIKN